MALRKERTEWTLVSLYGVYNWYSWSFIPQPASRGHWNSHKFQRFPKSDVSRQSPRSWKVALVTCYTSQEGPPHPSWHNLRFWSQKVPAKTRWYLSSVACPSTSKPCPNVSQNGEAHLPNNWSIQYHLQNQLFWGLVAASLLSATILFTISNRLQFAISSDPYSSTTLLKNSYCWWKKSCTTAPPGMQKTF